MAYEIFGIKLWPLGMWPGTFHGENDNFDIHVSRSGCATLSEGCGYQATMSHKRIECYISSFNTDTQGYHFDTVEEALDSLMVEMKAFAKTWIAIQ